MLINLEQKKYFQKDCFCIWIPSYQFYTHFIHVCSLNYFFQLSFANSDYDNLGKIQPARWLHFPNLAYIMVVLQTLCHGFLAEVGLAF